MKKLFLTLVCCFTATWCLANDRGDEKNYKYSQEKKFEKVFDVSPYCELEMDGDYSDFIITTWDQPQISFDVRVAVRSNKEKQMIEKFNSISVVFRQEGNKIIAETVIVKLNEKFDGSFSIKYYVSVPADVRMDLETKYGSVTVDNVEKNFKADVCYGNITAGNLMSDNEIDIKYGNVNVTYAKNIEIEMQYADAKFNKVEFIDADLEYSDLTAAEISRGVFENKYSDLRLENADDIKAKNAYTDMKIANLTQRLVLDAKYSPLNATISAKKPDIDIEGSYSDIKLEINEKSVFKYDIRTTYGDINCGEVMGSNAGRISEGRIVGKHGDGGAGNIKAELQYGDFKIE